MPALNAGNFVELYMGFGRRSQLVTGLAQYIPGVEPNGDCTSRHPDRHGFLLAEKVQGHQKAVLGQPPDLPMMEDVHSQGRQAKQVWT
jgi:hypothetical protein